jgi:branched-chain amino acid transport system ATP-binding protein
VQELFWGRYRGRAEGISIRLIEQNVRRAVAIANRAYVLDDGRVVYSGPAAEFAEDEEWVRALAGASAETWSG